MSFIVGLTGGIGSGKTTVADLFARRGAALVDTDAIAHELTGPQGAAMAAISAAFGAAVLRPDGGLDRAAMRAVVFSDSSAKARLEAILHPLIRQQSAARCKAATSAPYVLLVVPLLVENRLTGLADRVLVIDVDEATQIERTCHRDGVSREQAQAILASQANRSERLAMADDVLDNQSGTTETIRERILALHETYLAFASQQAPQV